MIPEPHGGKLVSVGVADAEKALEFSADQRIMVPEGARIAARLISTGVYSPLTGFNTSEETDSVLKEQRLPDGNIWPIPVLLQVSEPDYQGGREGEEILIHDCNGPVAVIVISEKFQIDLKEASRRIFGTTDEKHPGVSAFMSCGGNILAGPMRYVFPFEFPFQSRILYPGDTREYFRRKGWKQVTAFQTRNIPHLGHEYIHLKALESSDGLFINPVTGRKKSGDFGDNAIIAAYDAMQAHHYPEGRVLISPITYEMRYAGPREALQHAIMRKNFGASRFIVGRDHAGVGNYYGPLDAQRNCESFEDLGIEIMKIGEASYCKDCGKVTSITECSHGPSSRIRISGTDVRDIIRGGTAPDSMLLRKEVLAAVRSVGQQFHA